MVKAERRRKRMDLDFLFQTKITSSGLLETYNNVYTYFSLDKKKGTVRREARRLSITDIMVLEHYWNEGRTVNTPSNMAHVHTLFRHHRTHSNAMSA